MSEATEILEQLGGIEIARTKAPYYHRTTEKLSSFAGIKKPKLYIIPDDIPNAMAVGLSADDTAIGVTIGLFCKLNENEIESVIAHEIGHIKKNHCIEKTKVAMKAIAAGAAGGILGGLIATSDIDFTPGDGDSDDLLSVGLKFLAGAAVAGGSAYLGSKWLTEESLKSEFEADNYGAQITKKSWALASALKKLEALTLKGVKKFAPEVSQLFIISPSYLHYQTHPPTSERIKQLLELRGQNDVIADIPTMFCTTCGEKTDSDGKYCYWCGNELDK